MDNLIDKAAEAIVMDMLAERKSDNLSSRLNDYLFKAYCEKPYLSECEPFYCAFRYSNSCRYVQALRELHEKFDINLMKMQNR